MNKAMEFKIYYKICGSGKVSEGKAVGFFEGGNVRTKGGGWMPVEDTYLTREQAERHFCDCVSCKASRLPDEREYKPCPDYKKTQKVLSHVKKLVEDL